MRKRTVRRGRVRIFQIAHTVMASCESSRSSAYSSDLWWRIVWQRLAHSLPAKQVAVNLYIDVSTVNRIVHTFEATGSVDKKSYESARSFRKITEPAKLFIIYLVMDRPGVLLREIREELTSKLGITVTESAVCTFLHMAGFTRQRLKLYALQQDEGLRRKFALYVSIFNAEMLVFLDESGCDNRDSLRKKGYSLRGKPAKKLLVRGNMFSSCVPCL